MYSGNLTNIQENTENSRNNKRSCQNEHYAKFKVITLPIVNLTPYKNNAKQHPREQIEQIKDSIKENGFNDPVAVWGENNIIVEGHGRVIALKELGAETVDCIRLDHLTDEQRRAYTLTHNKLTMDTDFDVELLNIELDELSNFDIEVIGFDEIEEETKKYDSPTKGILKDRFLIPPFSILDTRQGYWQSRKKQWQKILNSGKGRKEGLLGDGLAKLAKANGSENLTGTSIFDPVLSECLVNWFAPKNGNVIDCFAGGSVRGIVTEYAGRKYTGVDLSEEQINENKKTLKLLQEQEEFKHINPTWINGDSAEIDKLARGEYDFLLTCPPYVDLEIYSDNPKDISNMSYEDFAKIYSDIIFKTVSMLKENAFAAIVVGSVRNKQGYYTPFIRDTIKAFESAGMNLYNEMVLVETGATAALRAGKQFSAKRKVVKMHQNILVFIKGDPREIDLSDVDYDIDELAEIIGVEAA